MKIFRSIFFYVRMHVKIINACAIFYSLIRVEAPNDPLLNEVDHRKEELVDHLFFKCSKTWAVRRKIMLWLGIARRSTTIRSVIKWTARQIRGFTDYPDGEEDCTHGYSSNRLENPEQDYL